MASSLFDLNTTIGALFISLLLAAVIHGITTMQTVFYFSTYTKDRALFKGLVIVVWILDTASLIFIAHTLYTYLILDFGNALGLLHIIWTIGSEPAISSTVALIVHQFLIYRIWALNNSLIAFAIFLSVFSFLPYSLALVSVGKTFLGSGLWMSISGLRWIVITANVTTSFLDITIASTICLQLHRSRTEFKKTQKTIQLITLYTLSSGLLTSVVSLSGMIMFLASPKTFLFQIFNGILAKVYANAFLSSLNSRQSIRGVGYESTIVTSSASRRAHSTFRAANPFEGNSATGPGAYDISLGKVGESSNSDSRAEDVQCIGLSSMEGESNHHVKVQHVV